MDSSPQKVLERLRAKYLQRSSERLAQIEHALDSLELSPADHAQIETLVRGFHGFAGSAQTYGFEQVTLLGQEGEALAQRLAVEHDRIDPQHFRRLHELTDLIRRHLESEQDEPLEGLLSLTPPVRRARREKRTAILAGTRSTTTALRSMLRDGGIEVALAADAETAMSLVDGDAPDVLITDAQLGETSGFDLIRRVRNRPDGDRTAAFVIRSHEDFLDKVEAIRSGADGSFQEPIDETAILRRVQLVLQRLAPEPPVILSVEDEPDQAEYIRTVLESAGYTVHTIEDPKQFEKALSRHDPDLLLMDVLLPDVSGYELARYVRQDEAHAALPILFLTTESQAEAAIESIRAGADDILLKPVSPTMLLTSVAARIERARMLTHLLERDGLTGLLTHTAFIERLGIAIKEHSRSGGRPAALVMLDIDHFKKVNDRYGHPAGDRVLASLAGYLRRRLRQSDSIGRYGGEEFAVLLHDLNTNEARRLFEEMLDEFSRIGHPLAADEPVHVEFSGGIAMLSTPATGGVDAWINAADAALYRAKKKGRRRIEVAAGRS